MLGLTMLGQTELFDEKKLPTSVKLCDGSVMYHLYVTIKFLHFLLKETELRLF